MRIVIEIEGAEMSAKNSQVNIESKLPPPDVVEKAAALGAQDAGAAPTQNMGPQTSPMPSQTNPPGTPEADKNNLSAGGAPQLPSGQ